MKGIVEGSTVDKVVVDKGLSIKDFYNVVFENKEVSLEPALLERVKNSFNFLKEFSSNKVIYGVNTGFDQWLNIKLMKKILFNYNII